MHIMAVETRYPDDEGVELQPMTLTLRLLALAVDSRMLVERYHHVI